MLLQLCIIAYTAHIMCIIVHTGCRNMLRRDIYIVLGLRARRCIMLLGCVGGTSLRTMSLSTGSSLQGLRSALPRSWKGSQVLVRVSTQCQLELENFFICSVSPRELEIHKTKFLVENSALNFFFLLDRPSAVFIKAKTKRRIKNKRKYYVIAFLSLLKVVLL